MCTVPLGSDQQHATCSVATRLEGDTLDRQPTDQLCLTWAPSMSAGKSVNFSDTAGQRSSPCAFPWRSLMVLLGFQRCLGPFMGAEQLQWLRTHRLRTSPTPSLGVQGSVTEKGVLYSGGTYRFMAQFGLNATVRDSFSCSPSPPAPSSHSPAPALRAAEILGVTSAVKSVCVWGGGAWELKSANSGFHSFLRRQG